MKNSNIIADKIKYDNLISIYKAEHKCYQFFDNVKDFCLYDYFYFRAFSEHGYVFLNVHIEEENPTFINIRRPYLIYTKKHFENISKAKQVIQELEKKYPFYKFVYKFEVIEPTYPKCIPIYWHNVSNYQYIDILEIHTSMHFATVISCSLSELDNRFAQNKYILQNKVDEEIHQLYC